MYGPDNLHLDMKTIFTLILTGLLTVSSGAFAQNEKNVDRLQIRGIVIRGIITGEDNKQPLAYASVGLLNKPTGTISDSLGHFELAIGPEDMADTLRVSTIGYLPLAQPVRELEKRGDTIAISLTRQIIQLNEVIVSNQFTHTLIVGRQSAGKLIQASIIPKGDKAPTVGGETGISIQAPHYPAILDNVNFYISANNYKYIKFRVNIYSIKNNLPDTLLFNKEILVSLNNYKTGWTQVDLTADNLVINADCAVTLQWVDYNKDMANSPQVLIPAGISLSHITYFRIASQDKWRSVKGNPSFYVTLRD